MQKKQYIIFETEAEQALLPFSDRYKGLITYVKETDRFYRVSNDFGNFRKLLNEDGQFFTASNFVNLTLFHRLNTERVIVICMDKVTGEHFDFAWKTGNGVRSNLLSDSSITIMSEFPVLREISILVTQI